MNTRELWEYVAGPPGSTSRDVASIFAIVFGTLAFLLLLTGIMLAWVALFGAP